MTKHSSRKVLIVATASVIAILFSAIVLVSPIPNRIQEEAFAQADTSGRTQNEMLQQNIIHANTPITLPLTKGYVNGNDVFYISTEASDKDLAAHLTNVTGARVTYAPSLANAPPASISNIYAFKNGIKGSGPLRFQPNVADSQPGDNQYSPLWRINIVEWKQGVSDHVAADRRSESMCRITHDGARRSRRCIKHLHRRSEFPIS